MPMPLSSSSGVPTPVPRRISTRSGGRGPGPSPISNRSLPHWLSPLLPASLQDRARPSTCPPTIAVQVPPLVPILPCSSPRELPQHLRPVHDVARTWRPGHADSTVQLLGAVRADVADHHRPEAVLQRVGGAGPDAPGGRNPGDHTVSTSDARSVDASDVPKKAEAYCLMITASVPAARPAASVPASFRPVGRRPAAPVRRPSGRTGPASAPRPGSAPRCGSTGTPDAADSSRTADLDRGGGAEIERAAGVKYARIRSIRTNAGRAPPRRPPNAAPGPRPARPVAGDHRPAHPVIGGRRPVTARPAPSAPAEPVSSSHRSSSCSRPGPMSKTGSSPTRAERISRASGGAGPSRAPSASATTPYRGHRWR